jgi:beta-galactosidase
VKNGGRLIIHSLSGIKDNDTQIYPNRIHPILHSLIGADIDEFLTSSKKNPKKIKWNKKTYLANYFFDLPILNDAKTIGKYDQDWIKNTPAILENTHGQGKVYFIASFLETTFYTDFFSSLVLDKAIKKTVLFEIPKNIEVLTKENAKGEKIFFVLSTSNLPIKINLQENMIDIFRDNFNGSELTMKPFESAVLVPTK